jgi:hypothetical protein
MRHMRHFRALSPSKVLLGTRPTSRYQQSGGMNL